ncbi:2-oxoacid:acceptor oxidoreductase subunit alpha [Marine Group I thaumarchaeote]|jgi:2-oxoglutarate ferredoxin oxidoreductase subunit alpha|uniref:2-oxoacid:acceptor oxidoreductase subunit alpha n=2 Tax=Nitrososphaerota TaxID=651137 RepID=A0A7K4MM97_9ARCH|nr:putative Pyruvate flavodoxin/ferredoxin oxidoreductase, thiamine diP-binding domain protein [uncultured marine crenarchaeote HF4000_APKG8G2]NMJ67326.1 2-oxoacid:acceptor oxidoreductase subunit alpha [Marine Group I thaumarchaeote]PBO82237.1 MAG: 2-oxoacid:acceptor oxidoreductase subunit alpha [Nitrosopumilales archaeon]HIP50095.1 2-oxoacid:acceptor oxidoreductase subunit alpha [Candidatus Paceibacterota bacterium]NWJ42688.1 2-oxoacid:acceptor oxidoreductase subunit alpha [Marine Group I thau
MAFDYSWLIGGPQGSGVDTAANIFSRVGAKLGYHVFGKREYHSNIKGLHSYFVVRLSDKKIRSNINGANIMVAYDAETLVRHGLEIIKDGAIIYDASIVNTTVDQIPTLEASHKARLLKFFNSKNMEPNVSSILDLAKENGVKVYPISFRDILSNIANELNSPELSRMVRLFNVLGVSFSLGILKAPIEPLLEAIEDTFSKKPSIVDLNKKAANFSYNYASAKFSDFNSSISKIDKESNTLLVQGHQGSALGKIVCGCRFQSYYPITPASDESEFLETHEILQVKEDRPGSTTIVQTEDEISAIGMAVGASLTGVRSATSTSGPGFSLMAETLGWAGINETPVVITLFQRSGPSTGLPTRQGQDDLLFAINAGHGEFPRIVYASGDVEDSFYDTCKCFNFADIFQVPVIHILDKFIASSVVTCKRFEPDLISIDRGKLLEKIDGDYKRFAHSPDGISPRSKLGLENGVFWNTGDESDEYGHISEDPVNRIQMMDKRQTKVEQMLSLIPKDDQAVAYGKLDICIVSWGSPKGPILDAIEMHRNEGHEIGFIDIKLLHPFPTNYIKSMLKDSSIIIDIEANMTGQLASLIRENLLRDPDYYVLKYTGRPMTCIEIFDSLKKILEKKSEKKQVLTYGD